MKKISNVFFALMCLIMSTDGHTQIKIGNKIWLAKNLNVDTFRNGDKIPEAKTAEEWMTANGPAWCYYNNDSENGKKYGKLYNWYAVNDPRGLAPMGWRIPTGADWYSLDELFTPDKVVSKIKSKTGWLNNKNGTNESNFTALPGGYRNPDGGFVGLNTDAKWWGASQRSGMGYVYYLYFANNRSTKIYDEPSAGLSIRCIKE